jgi:hypothetical protein
MSKPKNGKTVTIRTSPGPVTLHFDQVVAPGFKSVLEGSLPGPSSISGKGPATWRRIEGTLTKSEVAAFDERNLDHVALVAHWIRQLVERQLGVMLEIPPMPGIGITVDSTTAKRISEVLVGNAQAQSGECGKHPPAPKPVSPSPKKGS